MWWHRRGAGVMLALLAAFAVQLMLWACLDRGTARGNLDNGVVGRQALSQSLASLGDRILYMITRLDVFSS